MMRIAVLFFLLTAALPQSISAQEEARHIPLGIGHSDFPHNFNPDFDPREMDGARGAELCSPCHVPYDRQRGLRLEESGLPWDGTLASATFKKATEAVWNPNAGDSQPTGYSKMCIGCHDGSAASDVFDRYHGGGSEDSQAAHLVSVAYVPAQGATLRPQAERFGGSGTIADVLQGGTLLQCSSCHDVHDQPGESAPGPFLLRAAETPTEDPTRDLCLSCHTDLPEEPEQAPATSLLLEESATVSPSR